MIVNRLENLLKENNMTITDLSKAISISRNSLSNLINNNQTINSYKTDTIEKICSYFQIGIEDFLILATENINIFDNISMSNSSENNLESYSSAGTLFVKDQFNHIGQVEYSLNFNISKNSSILINDKKTPVGFADFNIHNNLSYTEQGELTDSFTKEYFSSIFRNIDNIDKLLSKAIELALIDIEETLKESFDDLALILKGFSPDFEDEIKITYLIDLKILKATLINFEISDF
ncbi:helix-turn-helix domain-containing protein [Vagococcus carniphilus]|uniref:helix-turn-helix domain-containing protein n=1 Tax=Vagococcus carniphilus TaxID=218144 RepID=UPI002891BDAE|nr:helix-turn-helix transcriptional regulator [Vagococcus carniphilus]MDT2865439.1 helix-turn-helix transcriptional regulator [Vagococcus carniphilus]